MGLQKSHYDLKFVVDRPGRLLLFFSQEGSVFEHVLAFDIADVKFVAGLLKICQRLAVGGQRLGLFGQFYLFEVSTDGSGQSDASVAVARLGEHRNTGINSTQLGFLGEPAIVGFQGILAGVFSDALPVVTVFDVVGALGMPLLFAPYQDDIRPNLPSRCQWNRPEQPTILGLDALEQIDVFILVGQVRASGEEPAKLVYSLRVHWL